VCVYAIIIEYLQIYQQQEYGVMLAICGTNLLFRVHNTVNNSALFDASNGQQSL
jgi:hypothetical protein